MSEYDYHHLGEEYIPDQDRVDDIYATLTAYVEESEDGYCYRIENEDEQQIAEYCCFGTEEEAEEAADEKRYDIANHLAQREERE